MKRILTFIIIVVMSATFVTLVRLDNSQKDYLTEDILYDIMYDYNFLTGNNVETTTKYFEELKTIENNYSINNLKKLDIYNGTPEYIVLKIQSQYLELTDNISTEEKKDIDKYLLENSLKYYYESEKN